MKHILQLFIFSRNFIRKFASLSDLKYKYENVNPPDECEKHSFENTTLLYEYWFEYWQRKKSWNNFLMSIPWRRCTNLSTTRNVHTILKCYEMFNNAERYLTGCDVNRCYVITLAFNKLNFLFCHKTFTTLVHICSIHWRSFNTLKKDNVPIDGTTFEILHMLRGLNKR